MYDAGKMYHSTSAERNGAGENLYRSSNDVPDNSDHPSVLWYDEETVYDYVNPDNSTGVYGHFTQMIWNGSTKMGCGKVGGYVACRYAPAGNMGFWGDDYYKYYRDNVKPKLMK